MSARPIYLEGRIVDPAYGLDGHGHVLVAEGRIAEIGPGSMPPPESARCLRASDFVIAPGLVDLRAELRAPADAHIETLEELTNAAVAGGVTTLAGLPVVDHGIEEPALVAFLARRAEAHGKARLLPYANATRGRGGDQLSEMGLLAEAGAVGFSDAPAPIASSRVLRHALSYAKGFDRLIVEQPAEPTLSAGAATEGELATRLGLPGTPAMSETIAVERALRIAELTGGRLHLGPLSTAGAIEAVRAAKRRGVVVTCDTAPHYFALNETAIGDYRSFAKVSPPLRDEGDRRAVIAGLLDGTIDAIASHHAPHDADQKRLPYAQAASGMIGLETLLPLTLELVHNRQLTLSAALRLLSESPAQILRAQAGRIVRGAPADLVVIDPDRPYRIDATRFVSKCRNTPFDGRPVQGGVVATLIGGEAVFLREGSVFG